jgi:hypothetical protein
VDPRLMISMPPTWRSCPTRALPYGMAAVPSAPVVFIYYCGQLPPEIDLHRKTAKICRQTKRAGAKNLQLTSGASLMAVPGMSVQPQDG